MERARYCCCSVITRRLSILPLPPSTLAAWLFFAPMFLQRAFIGGMGDSYSDYTGIGLAWVGYVCNICLLFLACRLIKFEKKGEAAPILFLIGLACLSVFQLLLSSFVTRISIVELALPLGRGWLWLLAVCSYFFFFFRKDNFVEVFSTACRLAGYVSIICFISYLLTTVPFGVHIARGYPRVQGFFSEPSALAPIFPAAFYCFVYQKKWRDALISLIAVALSSSVIVYIIFAAAAFPFFAWKFKKTKLASVIIYSYCAVVVLAPLVINPENASDISSVSAYFIKKLGDTNDNTTFYQVFLGRILNSLATMGDVVSTYSVNDLGGGLARLIGPIITINDIRSHNLQFVGYGLNVYGYVCVKKYGDIFDFGYYPFLISSFGYIFSIASIIVVARKICDLRADPSGIQIIFLASFFATLINSAGGIHVYALPMLVLIWGLFPNSGRGYNVFPKLHGNEKLNN